MNRFEAFPGRSQRLLDRGIRRFRSPLWFLRADTPPLPTPGPWEQHSHGSDDHPETGRI